MFKKLWRKWGPNPLDRILKKAALQHCRTIVIPWNRGMGDIALGLYAIVHRIRTFIPDAEITFVTRPDLEEPFQLLSGVGVIVDPAMRRGEKHASVSLPLCDLVLENADPSYWVAWQRGVVVPKMEWRPCWDELCLRFNLPTGSIGAHVSCETNYYFERNWPAEKWQALFSSLKQPIILFGLKKNPLFTHPKLYDLRGETSTLEILSIIKNRCTALIAPDSGILGLTYFLNVAFPLKLISLWADPNHGILKQNVPSPNPLLMHTPVISASRKDAALITPEEVRNALFSDFLSPDLLLSQREKLKEVAAAEVFEPVLEADPASPTWAPLGIHRLTQGTVASLILAGGQGSRLGASVPKALVIVTPDGAKTLLELHLEKIQQASILHQTKIPCAIITSPENHDVIAQFLKTKGLEELATLVMQNEAPFLDDDGNWILREDGKLAKGPDGNGYALHLLQKNGILKEWRAAGIQEITLVPIDNPLADPVDPVLIGYHVAHPADVTLKVITRHNPEEKVGIIVRKNGHVAVQEYSELPSSLPKQTCLAHIGLFALSLDFAERVSKEELPWHLARKQDPASKQLVWKFERFIFDVLPFSHKTNLLLYPRDDVYSPLKNATGEKSLATVQAALKALFSSGNA
jgi:UDP-N-acetylglucosamine/UDP-N-acetylgalactosamine diphosphorylase